MKAMKYTIWIVIIALIATACSFLVYLDRGYYAVGSELFIIIGAAVAVTVRMEGWLNEDKRKR